MKILNLIEEFSEHKKNKNIENCFQCLMKYKDFASKFKNFSSFESFDIDDVKSKKVSFLWNQIKFEKALSEYNFKELYESFDEIYKIYFGETRELNEDFWENMSSMLKSHNSKIYEVNIIKLEVEIIKEIITSYNYKLPIPVTRKVQKIIELCLIASKEKRVLRTLNKYFHLIKEEKLELTYYQAFPESKSKNHFDNFYHKLKKNELNRDIRIDVLVDKLEVPISDKLEKKTRYITQAPLEDFFSYLVPSRTLTQISVVEQYISESRYKEALNELENYYRTKDLDTNYHYLKSFISYRLNGALQALREIQNQDIESIVLADKEFLSFVARLRIEILVQGENK